MNHTILYCVHPCMLTSKDTEYRVCDDIGIGIYICATKEDLSGIRAWIDACYTYVCLYLYDVQKYYFEGTYHCMKLTKTDKSVSMH